MFQLYNKKAGQHEPLRGIGSVSALSLNSGSNKGLPFKILLILYNALGHQEPREFNTESIKVVSFPLNTTSLSQPRDQRVRGTFKAQYTWHSMEMFVNAMEENPDGTS